jgi:hypothetical protein
MTEPRIMDKASMNKASRSFAKPLRDLVGKVVGETFTRQGFASAELVTRWTDIVGVEIAAHSQPIKIQWARPVSPSRPSPASGGGAVNVSSPASGGGSGWGQEPGTLVLRVEGPAAIEIQHLPDVVCERVNRFLGWRAVGRIALRQAPLRRAGAKTARRTDAVAAARIAESLSDIGDDELKAALGRLGAAIKRP